MIAGKDRINWQRNHHFCEDLLQRLLKGLLRKIKEEIFHPRLEHTNYPHPPLRERWRLGHLRRIISEQKEDEDRDETVGDETMGKGR